MNAPVLEPGERVIFRVHPSIVTLLFPLALLALSYAAFVFVFCPQAQMSPYDWPCLTVSGIVLPTVAAVVALDWLSTWYVLTNQRVIRRSGIIGREATDIPLHQVTDVTVQQDIVGRILDYGTVTVESAGKLWQVRFAGMADPFDARQQIVGAVSAPHSEHKFL